ncbi:hypothetical protein BYT27DRAFT_7016752, partial [Phlegmacium glaucopus]
EYLVPGEPTNLIDLSYALLQFAHGAKFTKATTDIIRAFALVMTDIATHHIAEELVASVKTQMINQMELYNNQVETMRDMVENVTKECKDITTSMADLKDDCTDIADKITQVLLELSEKTTELTAIPPTTAWSYAEIAQSQQIPNIHLAVITCGQSNDWKLLMQRNARNMDSAMDKLTEKELVVKANTALKLMEDDLAEKPSNIKFIGVKIMKNSNILYQLTIKEAADWLRQPEIQTQFESHYDRTSNIKSQLFHIIVEFVPTTFKPGLASTHMKIEDDSSLTPDSIVSSKYIKPKQL